MARFSGIRIVSVKLCVYLVSFPKFGEKSHILHAPPVFNDPFYGWPVGVMLWCLVSEH